MSETREEFRERIGKVNYGAYDGSYRWQYDLDLDPGDTWEVQEPDERRALTDAAEAVYAQAIRDVIALSFMTYIPGTDDLAPIVAVSQIKRFAADRGIDLEDTP